MKLVFIQDTAKIYLNNEGRIRMHKLTAIMVAAALSVTALGSVSIRAQNSYEYPFLGMKLSSLPEGLLRQIKDQSIAMISNEIRYDQGETFFVDKNENIVAETYSRSHELKESKEIVEKELANEERNL